jgi:4-phytase/acid phosphatase
VFPARGCPGIRIVADSDQRTIETARNWARTAAPGCTIAADHLPQGTNDPRFGPIEAGLVTLDPAQVDAAIAQGVGPGGMAAIDAAQRPLLARIDAILCGKATTGCGLGTQPAAISPARPDRRPKLGCIGPGLDHGPDPAAGIWRWQAHGTGRVGPRHARRHRPALGAPRAGVPPAGPALPVARANLSGLLPIIREGLTGDTPVTLISGHDTNVANLGGLLDLHWQVPGLAQDDPAPGGAIVLERLRGRDGALYLRASYRAQSLDQIRRAAPLGRGQTYRVVIPIPGCAPVAGGLCRLQDGLKLLGG